ncbi:MAG: hypothetical protein WA865_04935 [Spirulinaceae cyanobacterium]
MNNLLTKLILIGLLLLLILAPFGGLAPLMLIMLIGAIIWGIVSVFQVLLLGNEEMERRGDSEMGRREL